MTKKFTKRRENGLLAFSVDLSAVLKSFKKDKVTAADIKEAWKQLCPDVYAGQLTITSLKAGLLSIKASCGPIALEASSLKEPIKEKINTYFGNNVVIDIKITQ